MPNKNSSDAHSPNQQTSTKLQRRLDAATQQDLCDGSAEKEYEPRNADDLGLDGVTLKPNVEWIPQKILGVARKYAQPVQLGIFDENPTHMAPEEAGPRTVGIRLLIGVLVVSTVHGDPSRRGVLRRAHAHKG